MFQLRDIITTPLFLIGLLLEFTGHLLEMIAYLIDFGADDGLLIYWTDCHKGAQKRVESCSQKQEDNKHGRP